MKPIFFILLIYLLSSVPSWGQSSTILKSQKIIERDGKFGLLDAENKIVLEPIYDEIVPSHNKKIGPVERISQVFMLRKGDKWALTYYVDVNCHEGYATDSTSYWFKSDFVYEDFVFFKNKVKGGAGFYSYVIIGYKLEGKWGLFSIAGSRAEAATLSYAWNYSGPEVPGCLGPMHVIAAQYDEIVPELSYSEYSSDFYQAGHYFALLNGKWRIFSPVNPRFSDEDLGKTYSQGDTIHVDYEGEYDEPPSAIEFGRGLVFGISLEDEIPKYRRVKVNGKRGLIKNDMWARWSYREDTVEEKVSQIVPCHCDTVLTSYVMTAREQSEAKPLTPDEWLFFLCVIKTNTFDSLIVYDRVGRRRSSVMSDRNSDLDDWYFFEIYFVETSPDGTGKPFQYIYDARHQNKIVKETIDEDYWIVGYILFSDTGLIGSYEANGKYNNYSDIPRRRSEVDIYYAPTGLLVLVCTNLDNGKTRYEFFDGLNNELQCSFELSPQFVVGPELSKVLVERNPGSGSDVYDYYCTVYLKTYSDFKVKKRYYYDFKKKCFIKGSLPKADKIRWY